MENITYIVPLNEFNGEVETRLETLLKSIKENRNTKSNTVIFVGPNEVISKASIVYDSIKCKNKLTLVENDETDFYTQVNKAVMQCLTPYFMVLEFDDELYNYWTDEFQNYNKYYSSSVFMPLNELINTNGKVVSLANEIALSNSFTNEQGVIDIECLESYMDFNVTGAVIKTEDFISIGGLKPSLKIASWYEFLLRMCYNNKEVRVVPKVGYRHTIGRDGSYMETVAKETSTDEVKWLIKTAQQEYFFKEDRNKVYEP